MKKEEIEALVSKVEMQAELVEAMQQKTNTKDIPFGEEFFVRAKMLHNQTIMVLRGRDGLRGDNVNEFVDAIRYAPRSNEPYVPKAGEPCICWGANGTIYDNALPIETEAKGMIFVSLYSGTIIEGAHNFLPFGAEY